MKEDYFAAYLEKNRSRVREKLEAKAEAAVDHQLDREIAKIPFTFTFADAAKAYKAIVSANHHTLISSAAEGCWSSTFQRMVSSFEPRSSGGE